MFSCVQALAVVELNRNTDASEVFREKAQSAIISLIPPPGVRLPALWSGFKCAGHRTGSEIVTEACRGRCAGYATGDGVAGVPAFGAAATTAPPTIFTMLCVRISSEVNS
jgi:hypothetical protein